MQRFLAKPVFTRAEITHLLVAYEDRLCARAECRCSGRRLRRGIVCRGCGLYRRKKWNRKNTRQFLMDLRLTSLKGPGKELTYSMAQIQDAVPDLVRSMVLIDEHETAAAA